MTKLAHVLLSTNYNSWLAEKAQKWLAPSSREHLCCPGLFPPKVSALLEEVPGCWANEILYSRHCSHLPRAPARTQQQCGQSAGCGIVHKNPYHSNDERDYVDQFYQSQTVTIFFESTQTPNLPLTLIFNWVTDKPQFTCEGQRTAFRSQVPLSCGLWVLGTS